MVMGLEKEIATKTDNQYGWPVFHYGRVLRTFGYREKFNEALIDKTRNIRDELAYLWGGIRSELEKTSGKSRGLEVRFSDEETSEKNYFGQIVLHYPSMDVFFDDIQGKLEPHIEIGIRPTHSKVWLQLSYQGKNKQDPQLISFDEVQNFYSLAEGICGKGIKSFVDAFKQVVLEDTGIKPRGLHTLILKTAPVDLGSIAQRISSKEFKVSEIFGGGEEYGPLHDLLNMTHGSYIPDLESYEKIADNYSWTGMDILETKKSTGIHSMYHTEDGKSLLTGVVHEVSKDPLITSQTALEFSKTLIQDIFPRI